MLSTLLRLSSLLGTPLLRAFPRPAPLTLTRVRLLRPRGSAVFAALARVLLVSRPPLLRALTRLALTLAAVRLLRPGRGAMLPAFARVLLARRPLLRAFLGSALLLLARARLFAFARGLGFAQTSLLERVAWRSRLPGTLRALPRVMLRALVGRLVLP
ncbi:hypothetical protein [Actinomadura parmotrematis]|uniref:Uncharacterized protein n=1 Tax=Actinomadura parmotrematis TaxID=2864039 RepID=A0ABS7FUJ7_9ACTN|nr:hypothetical protein [Actinomadura parmotrematis]MBW8483971.1 hypothetical protein [Actinomadura parmotrematis]